MRSAIRIAVALGLATLLAPGSARPDEERGSIPWWFTLQGGAMFPAARGGAGIRTGSQSVGTIGYEVGSTIILGGDLGYISSTDDLKTRLVQLGAHVRMNPNPELPSLYVQGGGSLFYVYHEPSRPDPAEPPDKVRPGLSFGIGYDITSLSKLTFGVVGLYNGVMIARSDALSFLSLGLYASFRPGAW